MNFCDNLIIVVHLVALYSLKHHHPCALYAKIFVANLSSPSHLMFGSSYMFLEIVKTTPKETQKKEESKNAVVVQQLETDQSFGGHGEMEEIKAKPFTFDEMEYATENFKPDHFLGEGGFGKVFKGKLRDTSQVS